MLDLNLMITFDDFAALDERDWMILLQTDHKLVGLIT
jgi:hypothetical protein